MHLQFLVGKLLDPERESLVTLDFKQMQQHYGPTLNG
jgi:hypothetical protein